MKNLNRKLKQVISVIFLLIFTASSLLVLNPLNSINSDNFSEECEIKEENENKLPIKTANIGTDPWWNETFQYRRLINITNPTIDDITDYIVSFNFNYTILVNENKINSSLKDVRIVESGVLRDYFVQIDYPSVDLATVWFETNCTAGESQLDTYLYYGNNDVDHDSSHYNLNNRFGLAWYRFDEGTGSKVTDSIGNYADGNLYLMEANDWETGRMGEFCLDFDGPEGGQGERVNLPNINPTGAITVSAWVKSDSATGYRGVWQIVSKYSAYILGTSGYNSRRMAFIIYDTTWRYGSEYDVPDPQNWHLFIGTYDADLNTKLLYVDGDFKDSTNPTGNINSDSGGVGIGYRECCPTETGGYFTGQIDDVRFYDYALTSDDINGLYDYTEVITVLQEEESQSSDVTVTTYDIDGRIVPNAVVYLRNYTDGSVLDFKTTGLNGSVIFNDLTAGEYNFTVNYTLSTSGKEIVAYDNTWNNDIYNFTGLTDSADLTLNLWTIDFEIVDWNINSLNYAYINISKTDGGEVLETLRITDGLATFRWENDTQYYYEIWYDNEDYSTIPVQLNSSYIFRDNYDTINEKYYNHIIWVNKTNILTGSEYQIRQNIYTNGSTTIGNKKLIEANITLQNMTDFLDTVKIYYIDKNDYWDEDSIIYFNDSYSGGHKDFIEINIRAPPQVSSNLIDDNFEAYGLRIDILGYNSTTLTQCNGTVLIETVEACNIYNRTSLAKLEIQVVDTNYVPVQSCLVKVKNATGHSIINLTTDNDGYAYGKINSESEFWYLRVPPTENYTFTLEFYGDDKFFYVNESDKWYPSGLVDHYNYTLTNSSFVRFKLQIDIDEFKSEFTDYVGVSSVTWGNMMTFSVNYTIKPGPLSGWEAIEDPDEIILQFGGIKTYDMQEGAGEGIYTVTIDSSEFSAGYTSEEYWIEISGSKLGYIDPQSIYSPVKINSRPTGMNLYDYTTLEELPTNTISEYYNELINITLKYYDVSNNNSILAEAFTYDWDYGSGTITPDPMNSGYYTLEFDTSVVENVGTYHIEFTARRENYTEIVNFDFFINILIRPTKMKNSTGIVYVSESIYIFEELNFSFDYTDVLSDTPISNLDEMSYILQELDENGDPIQGTSESGPLTPKNNEFVLDLDTESREVGEYSIIVTLDKKNYDYRIAIISLTIMKRVIDITWPEIFINFKTEINSGATLQFEISLSDPNNNSAAITGANVYLTLGDNDYAFSDNGNGSYIVNIPSISKPFFMPETYTATLTIEKQNFETETATITIVINMQEIFGFPMFYFLMIVGSVVAVVASLATYRIVQQRRIPTFVKKARSMKKSIKGNKTVSDSLLYPSKEEFITKKLGDKWSSIGLSLEDIMGVKEKKKMKLVEAKEEFKGGAD